MSFKTDMERIAKNIGSDLSDLAKAVKIEVFRRAIMNTRVDTGRAKGNWQMTEGKPAIGNIENFDPSALGQISDKALTELDQTVQGISVSYLTNNLPYIQKLEELDAMVAIAVLQLTEIIQESARR